MDLPLDQILLGDGLDHLRTLPSDSLEACVVDPPYGLGSKDPSPEDIFMYVLGCTLEHGHDFMGRDWQIPSIAVWREVYRVLKPGGYVASFGGTRTFDLISVGLRMAGFECRDTISRFYPDVELPILQWVQGCLTPDVEVLTPQGWVTYESLSTDRDLLAFDPSDVTFSWARPSRVISYQYKGRMVRVQTALGSYEVTADHTVYHLAGGKWLPSRAATLDAAEVPTVEDLQGLLDELHRQRWQASSEEGVFKTVHTGVDCAVADGSEGPRNVSRQDLDSVLSVQEAVLQASSLAAKGRASSLLPVLQRPLKEPVHRESGAQGTGCLDGGFSEGVRCEDDGTQQPVMGGRSDLPPFARKLWSSTIREMPPGFLADGSEGWLCVRTSVGGGSASRSAAVKDGGGPSCGSRLQEQQARELDALPQSERAQTVRGTRFTRADLARFETTSYQGKVWCVTVPTGAFVARRNDYVFITGNSGMPKSHSIGKAIDKKLGEIRTEVVGAKPDHEGLANRWEGWGSALKPAWEPVLLFRKPFKGTLVDNVLKNGTGALNIDATRVRHASKADFDTHKKGVDSIREKGGSRGKSWKNSSDLSGASEVQSAGRWPANAVYEHLSTCQRVGTFEVAPHPQGPARFQKTSGGGFSDAYGNQLANEEPEVISEWRCEKGCPVAALNAQSGGRPSTLTGRADPSASHDHPGTEMNPNSTFLGERTHLSKVYADAGGAARFFTQIEGEPSSQRPDGRWPSNSLWVHTEGCRKVGEKKVPMIKGGASRKTALGKMNDDGWKPEEQACVRYGDAEGNEVLEAWECVDGCPVAALERQGVEAGVHAAGNAKVSNQKVPNKVYGEFRPFEHNPDYHADGSSTSRFFSQFEAEGGVPFKYVAKANRKEAGCGEFEVQHITLKPLKLIQWLVRLVCRKGGTVLDMYAGSGTTCHAAVLEGMHFIGIERDETNHAEAVRRLEIVLRREQERKEEEELLDFAMGRTE